MSSSSSLLLRMFPDNTIFDVHVLRTFTRDLNGWLDRSRASAPQAGEMIGQLILALNQTFREVELSYLVWRHERVQTVLQHGFQYNRARIETALWRRNRGRPAAAFPGIYTPFYYPGANASQPAAGFSSAGQASSWPPAQGDPSYFQANAYAAAVSPAGVPGTPKVQSAQNYPSHAQHPSYHHRSDSASYGQAGTLADYGQQWRAPAQDGGSGVATYYAPPPYPPPNWKPPSPVPGSPPIPTEVATAVDVACRYLEAVGKAINVCIDLNAM